MNLNAAITPESGFDVERIREEFPVLHQSVHDHPLVYLDNAATTQKPQAVMDALRHYYENDNANIHRGVHTLSERATHDYEQTRLTVRQFINAASIKEIVFTSGATESINLVAQSYARQILQQGDEILISAMEHHSNIVPWQLVCKQTGANLKVIPMNDRGELELDAYRKLLNAKTKLVAVTHLSNALGTLNPIKEIIDIAHDHNVPVLLDGAQAIAHVPVDVQYLDCDFYVFSAHKLFGPTGTGVLYGRQRLLEWMTPYQGGGDMIKTVTFSDTTYNDLPYKFEAGTPNIAGVIGMGAAIKWFRQFDFHDVYRHEHELLDYALQLAARFKGLRLIGEARDKISILSFTLDKIHPHDIGTILDHHGVAIRSGHHCAMPVMQFFNVPATARASFSLYNTMAEVDTLFAALNAVKKLFA
jgi:cysteine desulfurase/selenocysteine lyase